MILIDLEEYIQLNLISRIDLSPLNDCTLQHILENAKKYTFDTDYARAFDGD